MDDHDPSLVCDEARYQNFYANAEGYSPADASCQSLWRAKMSEGYSMPFHTSIYEGFFGMIDWINKSLIKLQSTWTQPAREDVIEFYFTVTK